MLKGIDISNNNFMSNGWLNAVGSQAYNESDFVICKATEGVGFVDRYCDIVVQRCVKDKKLWGFYHFANGNNTPEAEAEFFYNNTKNYFGHGVPVLDYECTGSAAWSNPDWPLRFIRRLHELSGVWAMLYIMASALYEGGHCNGCEKVSGLWLAGYPTTASVGWNVPACPYSTGSWPYYTLWQYTSADHIDRNVGNLTREGWAKLVGASKAAPTKPAPAPVKDYEKMASDVIAGKYGNGEERRRKLGADYDRVQAIVDKRLNGQPANRVHIVKAGETLSGIFGADWQRVAKLNNLPNPNLIYPGQALKY